MSKSLSDKLEIYKALLIKWQKAINLVSPSTLKDCETRHFADSTQIEPLLPDNTKVLYDLGCGAGFPGLVLAMMRPALDVHLIESDQRKCTFLSTVSRETETPVTVHNDRIEAITLPAPDLVSARALAALDKLFVWCLPWAEQNPDLVFIFPKGAKAKEEIIEAQKSFVFDVEMIQSKTDKEARILKISGLEPRL